MVSSDSINNFRTTTSVMTERKDGMDSPGRVSLGLLGPAIAR